MTLILSSCGVFTAVHNMNRQIGQNLPTLNNCRCTAAFHCFGRNKSKLVCGDEHTPEVNNLMPNEFGEYDQKHDINYNTNLNRYNQYQYMRH